MANVNKIKAQGAIYDIEDTAARTSAVVVTSKPDGTVELQTPTSTVTVPSITNFGDPSELENDVVTEISDLKRQIAQRSGLTADVKQALMDLFDHIGGLYTDSNAQTYIENLRTALYPPANLVSITAVYTQSGTVYDNQTLDSLKSDLVVTAYYDNSTSEVVTNYTLSGELTTGTSTVTAAFGGKTATFTVTVTHATAQYTIINSLTNCTNSNSATVVNEETAYTGTLTADSGYILSTVSITMSGTDITSTVYDSSDGSINIASVTGNVVITAEAIEDVGWISGVPYNMASGLTENKYLNNGVETAYNGWAISDYLPCKGAYLISDTNFSDYCAAYNAEKAYQWKDGIAKDLPKYVGADYFRISASRSAVVNAVVTPYILEKVTESTLVEADKWYTYDYTAGGYYQSSDGSFKTQSGYNYSDFINCYSMTTISDNQKPAWMSYCFYDGNKTFISGVTIAASDTATHTATIPANARYVKVSSARAHTAIKFE